METTQGQKNNDHNSGMPDATKSILSVSRFKRHSSLAVQTVHKNALNYLYQSEKSKLFQIENMPGEIITEVLLHLDSFKDLFNIIKTSSKFFRVFNRYRKSIMCQVAKNILGDAYEDATTVLVYQRGASGYLSNCVSVKKDLETEFILQQKDIVQLVANQRFFTSCSVDFLTFKPTKHRLSKPSFRDRPPPSFSTDEPLPIKLFYKAWVLTMQFGYENIDTFARREPLPEQEVDLYWITRIMYDNANFGKNIINPKWTSSLNKSQGTIMRDLFSWWGNIREFGNCDIIEKNSLLAAKITCHFWFAAADIHMGGQVFVPAELRALCREFWRDYASRDAKRDGMHHVEFLMKKYKLDDKWE